MSRSLPVGLPLLRPFGPRASCSRRGVLGAAAILLATLLAVCPLMPAWSACFAAGRQLAANRRRHRKTEDACAPLARRTAGKRPDPRARASGHGRDEL